MPEREAGIEAKEKLFIIHREKLTRDTYERRGEERRGEIKR